MTSLSYLSAGDMVNYRVASTSSFEAIRDIRRSSRSLTVSHSLYKNTEHRWQQTPQSLVSRHSRIVSQYLIPCGATTTAPSVDVLLAHIYYAPSGLGIRLGPKSVSTSFVDREYWIGAQVYLFLALWCSYGVPVDLALLMSWGPLPGF